METGLYIAVGNFKNRNKDKEVKFNLAYNERDTIKYLKMLTGFQKNQLDALSNQQRMIVLGGLDEKYSVTFEDHLTGKAYAISIGNDPTEQYVRIAKPLKLEVLINTCIGFDTTARALKYFFFHHQMDPTCNWIELTKAEQD